ncbi:MAG: hypothetical protein ACR2NU_14145 [Aeoliella sp.]
MVSEETKNVIERAKAIYERELRDSLEAEHRDRFVAIEPKSGDHFLADTFDGAVKAARSKYPSRLSHTIRIGHRAAFSIGLMEQ